MIGIPISSDLHFQLQGNETPNDAKKNLDVVFGTYDIQTQQLVNQLINLDSNYFSLIEDFF